MQTVQGSYYLHDIIFADGYISTEDDILGGIVNIMIIYAHCNASHIEFWHKILKFDTWFL